MRLASSISFVLVPVSLALLGIACSSDPSTVAPGADGGGEAGKTPEAGRETSTVVGDAGSCTLTEALDSRAACNTCGETNCCAEANACGAEADCSDFVTCASACLGDAGVTIDAGADAGDAGTTTAKACITACQKSHKTGALTYASLAQCINSNCKTECL